MEDKFTELYVEGISTIENKIVDVSPLGIILVNGEQTEIEKLSKIFKSDIAKGIVEVLNHLQKEYEDDYYTERAINDDKCDW